MATSEVLNSSAQNASRAPQNIGNEPKKRGWVWVVLILLVVGGIVAYQAKSRTKAADTRPAQGQGANAAVPVGVVPAVQRDVPFFLAGLGSVTAYYTVTLHSRVDGELMNVDYKEGQFVHKGDLLAEIDPRPFQVALDQASGQLAKDTASQNDAKVDLTRYQSLWQEGVIARQQLDTQQAMVGQFDGAIQSDKAQIDNEKLQLTYSKITSPIDGRVGLRMVDPGNIVHASDPGGIVVITEVNPIAVDFTLPEDNLPQVISEMKSQQLTVEAYTRDDNTKLAEGKLQTLDNQIDQTTGTIKLKAVFENKDDALWPNQFVNIRLYLGVKKGAVVIPSAAIQTGAQGPFLFVAKTNNTAEVRQIQVDFIQGNTAVIRQGLSAGDKVVTDGQDKIQGGSKLVPHASTTTRVPGSGNGQGAASDNGSGQGGGQGRGQGRGQGNRGKGGQNGAAGLSSGGQNSSGPSDSTNSGGQGKPGGAGSNGQHRQRRSDSQQGQNP